MPGKSPSPPEPSAAIIISAVLWGTSFPVIKFGLDYMDAYHFVLLRFVIAALLLSSVLFLQGKPFPVRLMKNRLVLILGASNAAGFFFQFAGMTLTTAIKTSLLVNSNFVLVIIVSAYLLKEKITPVVAGALVTCELGVVLLTTGGDPGAFGESGFLGDVLVLVASVVWVIYIVANKKAVSEMIPEQEGEDEDPAGHEKPWDNEKDYDGRKPENTDVVSLMTAVMCMTIIFLAPPSLYFGSSSLSRDPVGWAAVLYISVFCTALPFFFYSHGLRKVNAGISCIILLLEVVVASMIAVAFLKESLSPANMVGAVLIVVGIVVVSLRR